MNLRSNTRFFPIFLAVVMLLVTVGEASAQRRGGSPQRAAAPQHDEKIDISVMYGHMWGGNIETWNGNRFRLGTAPSWQIALDIPMGPATWVELSYDHQDGKLDWDERGQPIRTLSDMSVNYWQIGMVRGVPRGNVVPYGTFALGVTYYNPSESSFTIPEDSNNPADTYYLDSATKFSMSLGVGVKAFFGEAQRIGVRASFRTMPTFYNTGAGLWFGSGGAGVSVSGYAIWQWEVAAGLTIKMG